MIRKRTKPRKGRLIDKAYLAWLAQRPCLVTGRSPVTIHHVRRLGGPKDDKRTVPLVAELHLIMHNSRDSVEALGRWKFERAWQVDFDQAIERYNKAYALDHGEVAE